MSWSTSDELNFIDWLGTGTYVNVGTHHYNRRDVTIADYRLHLLRGYRTGIQLRTNWESLDPKKIEAHLNHLIKSIEQSTNQGDK